VLCNVLAKAHSVGRLSVGRLSLSMYFRVALLFSI
jgi:hypothetical protein